MSHPEAGDKANIEMAASASADSKKPGPISSKTGWDGKLRVDKGKKAVLANPEALEDSDYTDEDAPPVDQIDADEGQIDRR